MNKMIMHALLIMGLARACCSMENDIIPAKRPRPDLTVIISNAKIAALTIFKTPESQAEITKLVEDFTNENWQSRYPAAAAQAFQKILEQRMQEYQYDQSHRHEAASLNALQKYLNQNITCSEYLKELSDPELNNQLRCYCTRWKSENPNEPIEEETIALLVVNAISIIRAEFPRRNISPSRRVRFADAIKPALHQNPE